MAIARFILWEVFVMSIKYGKTESTDQPRKINAPGRIPGAGHLFCFNVLKRTVPFEAHYCFALTFTVMVTVLPLILVVILLLPTARASIMPFSSAKAMAGLLLLKSSS